MSSKKSKNKSQALQKPTLLEFIGVFVVLLMIVIIGIVVIFTTPSTNARLFFVAVESVTIEDNWSGLSDLAPIEVTYQLNFINGALVGTGDFSVGYNRAQQEQNIPIEIPINVTQAFLGKLKEAELIKANYEPNIMWTDDYPSLSITIDTRREIIELYSQSQDEGHTPWGAYMRNTEYVIDSAIPAEALTIIEPYLRKDILDNLVANFRESR